MKMSDEDDDGEHYFLQPVKGYNIVEKIKLANEQLYELEIPYKKNKRSKVQFRENLVDFEPDCSSDDGYGESGTSTSDHETKKNNKSYEESPCDLERELDNLRCCNDKKKPEESEDEESSVEEEEEACTKCASSDDEIPDETVCDSEHDYEDDVEEEDDENECHGECEKAIKKERTTKDCAECDIVEKVVAELVLQQVKIDEEDNKPKPEPPKKKKPLYKSKFGRYGRGNNQNDTFEVIETEFGRFRGCCRHKVEHVDGMPGYQGALSLYGLSEEQYAKREERLQKLELQEQQRISKLKEDYVKKTNETEDAFAQWLKQKAKSKPSRMRNMYDQRPKQNVNLSKVKSQKGPNKKVLPNNSAKVISNNVVNETKT